MIRRHPEHTTQPPGNTPERTARFRVGDLVYLRDDRSEHGAIVAINVEGTEPRYSVLHSGTVAPFYESQLIPVEVDSGYLETDAEGLRSLLSAMQILHPSTRNLHSLNSARIDFVPYQYRPVLKLIRSDQPRLLIADGVGVGKTIEAGLILRELQARRQIRRIMVICTKPLVTERKWLKELKRFDEDFVHLDGKTLRHCIEQTDLDGEWPAQYDRVIVPFSILSEEVLLGSNSIAGLESLDPAPHFDLVIVDEAHHIRNTETLRHAAVRFFSQNAEALLFLTATPIQLSEHDLFVLLNTLRPDVFLDHTVFKLITKPNPYINHAAMLAREGEGGWERAALNQLDHAAQTDWGERFLKQDQDFQDVVDLLSNSSGTRDGRVESIRRIERLHTLDRFMNRTLRRDIEDFTTRKPQTVSIQFTQSQQDLHDSVVDLHAEMYARLHGHSSVPFLLTTVRRQLSSCLPGLAPMLRDIIERKFTELDWSSTAETEEAVSTTGLEDVLSKTLELAESYQDEMDVDPKLTALLQILADKGKMENKRVMVFSSFRHTLAYLERNLDSEGHRVGMIHGGVADDERVALRRRFEADPKSDDAIDVLLFSEVGNEGLDYQFCDCIVNYDLPWNPMRIDQRIGRIDRRGQKSEAVAIYNLVTEGTIDAEIYHRCLWRIGVFKRALGANEVILGEITTDLHSVAEDLTLTEVEISKKLQQIEDNALRKFKEQEELENNQTELFGLRIPQDELRGQEVDEAHSYWLSPDAIRQLVSSYTNRISGTATSPVQGYGSETRLRLSREAREVLATIESVPFSRGNKSALRWRRYLEGDDPAFPIVFESEAARDNPTAALLSPTHPLVLLSAKGTVEEMGSKPFAFLHAQAKEFPAGDHAFMIYQWDYRGITTDSRLVAVSENNQVSNGLLELIQSAHSASDGLDAPAENTWSELDRAHHQVWADERTAHVERVTRDAQFRTSSLTASHEARLAILDQQIDSARSERIAIMRRGEKKRAQADFEDRIKTTREAHLYADIRAVPVARGVIRLEVANAQ
ncbi:DEAD/DEAH box helicase [Gemmatimonadales bacterium]|nr:DEAD/DEAH box helicase [Gemmatimonadales bacterium]